MFAALTRIFDRLKAERDRARSVLERANAASTDHADSHGHVHGAHAHAHDHDHDDREHDHIKP